MTKRRVTAAAVSLLLFSCLALLGAYNAHQLFSREANYSLSLWHCLTGTIRLPPARHWFLLLEACALLTVIWMLFSRQHVQYKSSTVKICPGIETPVADGQGQYGTARWMSEEELASVFLSVKVDPNDEVLRELRKAGRDDLEEGIT